MVVDCKNPRNDEERNLCACKNATEAFTKLVDQYTVDLENHSKDTAKHSRWKNKSGEYSKWGDRLKNIQDEIKVWNNCVAWSGIFGHHDWCQQDTGFGTQISAGQHGCLKGWGKGECKRTPDQVEKQMTEEGYYRDEPSIRPKPSSIPNTNIQCCSQIFSDISVTNGNAKLNDISQNCSQRINDALNTDNSSKVVSSNSESGSGNNKSMSSSGRFNIDINDTNTQIIVGIILLVLVLSSVIGIILM